jgi:dienelactone hydrolase
VRRAGALRLSPRIFLLAIGFASSLLGQSMGGSTALYAVDRGLAAQYFEERFRAAIAYYPGCAIAAASTMTAPTLILIGEADDWNPAERCREAVAHARPEGAPIDRKSVV